MWPGVAIACNETASAERDRVAVGDADGAVTASRDAAGARNTRRCGGEVGAAGHVVGVEWVSAVHATRSPEPRAASLVGGREAGRVDDRAVPSPRSTRYDE